MDELISRDAALACFKPDFKCPLWHFTGIRVALENVPTVDAVPVVRCKDCVCRTMWNDKLICSRISGVVDGYYHGGIDVVKPDDYCSYGKRQTAKPLDAKMNGA